MTNPACEVWFYHLERSSVEQVLPDLLDKTLARGWKALVRAPDRSRLEALGEALWTWRDDAFLAHGLEDEPFVERAPIALVTGHANPNGAEALFLLDGAAPGDLAGFARCLVVFDGQDENRLTEARARWSELKAQGLPLTYWKQSPTRGWERQG
jgi:DNA polymerase-3 subunit chi